MPSTLSWLDYSERDRRRAVEVIRLFEEKGTVDELGVGSVRDAFADLLFPGLSTIQSRAKYFLLIPWIYQQLEQKRVPSREIAARARQAELSLIDALMESDDPQGTIGKLARRALKTLPSRVYWAGLHTWGVRNFSGSQDQYHRSLDAFYQSPGRTLMNDDGEPAHGRPARNWHHAIPAPPADFPKKATLRLTRQEAEFLRERLQFRVPKTVLAFLVAEGRPDRDVLFPWDHPQLAEFPAHNRRELYHAQCFSEAMHGSSLLYNLMLAEMRRDDGRTATYREALVEWAEMLEGRGGELARWSRPEFWELVLRAGSRISAPTRLFIDAWLNIALGQRANLVADDAGARQLIHERERVLKRGLARLDNRRSLENWGGASGTGQLDYRWLPVVRDTIDDIQVALRGETSRAAD
jgi:hypothetical protein